ncbi:hypothetical protein [Desulfobulbus propionicus]|jgi:hypothetical protein
MSWKRTIEDRGDDQQRDTVRSRKKIRPWLLKEEAQTGRLGANGPGGEEVSSGRTGCAERQRKEWQGSGDNPPSLPVRAETAPGRTAAGAIVVPRLGMETGATAFMRLTLFPYFYRFRPKMRKRRAALGGLCDAWFVVFRILTGPLSGRFCKKTKTDIPSFVTYCFYRGDFSTFVF